MLIKKYYRKLYRAWLGKPLSIDEFEYVIKELLGISKGDSVLVHCSYGNLKADFSPKEAVKVLMEAVGDEGNLLMPYYPEDSKNWLEQGKVFDVRSTPTRSGILSATFALFPEVKKSLHPIKSLAVWGKDRDYLISTHHESVTPFDEKSPYYLLSHLSGSKTVGLGSYKNSFVHCAEDIDPNYPKYYSNYSLDGRCLDDFGNAHVVQTYFHAGEKVPRFTGYLINTNCPNYQILKHRMRLFYIGSCKSIMKHISSNSKNGLYPTEYKENSSLDKRISDIIKYKLNG